MLPILYEDNYLLAVNKPAGLSSGSGGSHPGAEGAVSDYLREKYPKKKQLRAGMAHRLDRPVEGVLLFALTHMAVKSLASQFEGRSVRKIYLALVENKLPSSAGELVHWLGKDSINRKAVCLTEADADARLCKLRYEVLWQAAGKSLVSLELLTGRYHQIRAQMAAVGCPVVGDEKYGSVAVPPAAGAICLQAHSLSFDHPKTGLRIEIAAPLPAWGRGERREEEMR